MRKTSELAFVRQLLDRGNFDAALAELQRIRRSALMAADWLLAEVASQHLATAFRQIGDSASASVWQQQSIAHRLRAGTESPRSSDSDLARLACELTGLGNDAFRLRDFDQAEIYWQRALAIEEWRGDWEGQALDIGNLGLLAAARGDYEQGIRRLRESFRLHCLMFDDLHAGIDLINLAELFRLTGDLPQSRRALKNAIKRLSRLEAAHWSALAVSRQREIERILKLRSLDPQRN